MPLILNGSGTITGVNNYKFLSSTKPRQFGVNSLEIYEEGVWTGTLQMLSTTNATSENVYNTSIIAPGTYTKIGKICRVSIFFDVTNYSNYTALKIDGLPFTAGPATEYSLAMGHCRGIRFNYNGTISASQQNAAVIYNSGTSIVLRTSNRSTSYTGFWYISNEAGQGKYIHVNGTYETST